jgi:hypothetical protein
MDARVELMPCSSDGVSPGLDASIFLFFKPRGFEGAVPVIEHKLSRKHFFQVPHTSL